MLSARADDFNARSEALARAGSFIDAALSRLAIDWSEAETAARVNWKSFSNPSA